MKKESEVHFENIRDKIITELRNAKFNIFIAVAWFTDKKLWVEVCNKAKNVQVQVLIIDDDINRNSNIDFNELVRNGGELFFADGNLHHKYCIIDLETTISGSYNWTHTANKRLKGESIEIKRNDNKISRKYANNFKDLLLGGNKYSTSMIENKSTNTPLELEKKYAPDLPTLIPYKKGKLWGFCDKDKNIIINPIYKDVKLFNDGLALVVTSGEGYNFINEKGEQITNEKYIRRWRFSNNLSLYNIGIYTLGQGLNENGIEITSESGFINKEGEKKIVFKNIRPNEFEKNEFLVFYQENEFLTAIGPFKDGLAPIRGKMKYKISEKMGFINTEGKLITGIIYDYYERKINVSNESIYFEYQEERQFIDDLYEGFGDGMFRVRKNGKYGFIDITGKEVLPCIYDNISKFSEGYALVSLKNKMSYFIGKDGKKLNKFENYDAVSLFSEGLAIVSLNSKLGYIDKTGKIVIPCTYYEAKDFTNGLAIVAGPFKRSNYESEAELIAQIFTPGFIIDKKENIIFRYDFKNISSFSNGLAKIMYNNSYGFIDNQGQIVISCIYDRVSDFSNGLSLVNKDGVDFYIDKKGVKYTDNIKTLQMRQLKG